MRRWKLITCLGLALAVTAHAQDDTKTADEEIDELLGPTLAETMVVTAGRNEVSVINAPVSVSVVGEKQLETTAADNYADLLRGVPGVSVTQTSARDINMKTRGATSTLDTSQLTMVDGRTVYLDFFGFVAWDLLPTDLEEVEQVEILRGPGSAVWGANALNGVINVRTKSPRDSQGGIFKVMGGEEGTKAASIRWADAPSDTFSYRIAASYSEQDPWPRSDTLPNGDPLPSSVDFINRGTEQPKLDLHFDWEPESQDALWSLKLGGAKTSGILHTGIGPFNIDDSTTSSYVEGRYEGRNIEAKVYANIFDGEAVNLLNALNFTIDTKLYAGDIQVKRAIGEKHFIVYGADARLSDFDLSIAPREDSRQEFGVFFEDQMILSEKFHMNLGIRADWFDTIGWTVSPRTSFLFKPRDNHSIRLAYNRAYRVPSNVNNYLETTIFNAVTIPTPAGAVPFLFPSAAVGNEDLDEESIDAFELAYTVEIGNRSTFTAAVYRNYTEDVIDFFASEFYSPTDPPPRWSLPPAMGGTGLPDMFVPEFLMPKTFTYRNVGKVRDQGIELGLNTQFNEFLSANFSYTYQDTPEVTVDNSAGGFELGTPPEHTFYAGLQWRTPRFKGSASVSYTDEALWTDVLDSRFHGTTDDYFLVDASFGYMFPGDHFELTLAATNLFDEEHQQHIFGDIIGRRATLGLKARW
ncbi:MAG: TonB-dependent receptor [Acidobacteriota bacterium]